MAHGPFEQFKIKPLFEFAAFGTDLSFTNSSMFMLVVTLLILSVFFLAMRKATLVPGRLQGTVEVIVEFIETVLTESAGPNAKKYFPLVFTIFMFVLGCNLIGLAPYSFTVTSHIAITFAIALTIFAFVTILAIVKHGTKFFGFFLPHGTPKLLAPAMIVIEIFSYFSRPISLSVRLAANMIAGHVLLKVLAGFVVMMGAVWGFIPIPFIVIMTGFEIFVAMLQAYIFTILTCVYLGDALNLH